MRSSALTVVDLFLTGAHEPNPARLYAQWTESPRPCADCKGKLGVPTMPNLERRRCLIWREDEG